MSLQRATFRFPRLQVAETHALSTYQRQATIKGFLKSFMLHNQKDCVPMTELIQPQICEEFEAFVFVSSTGKYYQVQSISYLNQSSAISVNPITWFRLECAS